MYSLLEGYVSLHGVFYESFVVLLGRTHQPFDGAQGRLRLRQQWLITPLTQLPLFFFMPRRSDQGAGGYSVVQGDSCGLSLIGGAPEVV